MGAAAAGGQGDAARVMHRNGKRVCAVPAGIAKWECGRALPHTVTAEGVTFAERAIWLPLR